ncbi:MAG: hypothetical protein CL915_05000 [Deltaproteobacteria bacterium]|nr:hypothetical protein [Deltaproteobacteria bacterium]
MNAKRASFFVAAWLLSSSTVWSCHEGGAMGFADGKLEAFSVDISSSSTFAFASSSGTMGCEDWTLGQHYEEEQFLQANWDQLTEEAANRSQDLHWVSLAQLAGCNPTESKQWSILANQHFATLFDSPASSEQARRDFRSQFNQHLSDAQFSCRLDS